jgi:tetrahydromethanopterin S-methyltransferase subunit H
MIGVNFIIYGPIKMPAECTPACAIINAMIAYYARALGIMPQDQKEKHYTRYSSKSSNAIKKQLIIFGE